jgi:predicted RecB family nuclease
MSKTSVHTVYKVDDARVPSVTTIIGILNKPALLKWAWQCGVDGIDYLKARDSAADAGTLAHSMILAHLKREELDTSEYSKDTIDQAENSFLSYLNWEKQHTLDPMIVEQPLVHQALKYGGTPDFYGKVDETLSLVDFKTGKGLYPEYEYQLAAYAYMLPEMPQIFRILRIGRDANDDYEEKTFTQIDKQWEIFNHCLEIYNLQKEMKVK